MIETTQSILQGFTASESYIPFLRDLLIQSIETIGESSASIEVLTRFEDKDQVKKAVDLAKHNFSKLDIKIIPSDQQTLK